jgi:hypothetical protein
MTSGCGETGRVGRKGRSCMMNPPLRPPFPHGFNHTRGCWAGVPFGLRRMGIRMENHGARALTARALFPPGRRSPGGTTRDRLRAEVRGATRPSKPAHPAIVAWLTWTWGARPPEAARPPDFHLPSWAAKLAKRTSTGPRPAKPVMVALEAMRSWAEQEWLGS